MFKDGINVVGNCIWVKVVKNKCFVEGIWIFDLVIGIMYCIEDVVDGCKFIYVVVVVKDGMLYVWFVVFWFD